MKLSAKVGKGVLTFYSSSEFSSTMFRDLLNKKL